jgi:polyisoprenoid-binding protein YceI
MMRGDSIMLWEIDPFHSLVEFSVQHLKISLVKGRFTDLHGSINFTPQKIEQSWVKAQVATASIHTGVPQRDAHLRSADFFEVATYPTIAFESTQMGSIEHNRGMIHGNLLLHGVTRPITLLATFTGQGKDPFTDAWRIGFSGTAIIDRREFGIGLNVAHGSADSIGFNVRIDVIIESVLVN